MDLRKESTQLFRTHLFALRDSLLLQTLTPVSNDSIRYEIGRETADTLQDTRSGRFITQSREINVFITADGPFDSLRNTALAPLVRKLSDRSAPDENVFMFRIRPDTLSIDSIKVSFQKVLADQHIPLTFAVKHNVRPPFAFDPILASRKQRTEDDVVETNAFGKELDSDWIPLNPANRYALKFYNIRPFLLRLILPQIGFSLFLLSLTALAFVMLYRSLREQQRLMALKNEFISNMTHELKTPISTVSVALEAIQNFSAADNPTLTAEYVDIARHELNRLTLLTDKVLRTSIFEEKGLVIDPEPVDLKAVVTQVLYSLKLVLDKHQAQVSVNQRGTHFQLQGSTVHLTNVVFNLLDNAVKYSNAPPEIEITLTERDAYLTLSVADNGIGIAPAYQSKIFEKFFRVPTGDIHTVKGYGLGLSYVYNVVKSHAGKIELHSQPGRGSTFVVTLPKTFAS